MNNEGIFKKNRKQISTDIPRGEILSQMNRDRERSLDGNLYDSIERKSSDSTFRVRKVKLQRMNSEGGMANSGIKNNIRANS